MKNEKKYFDLVMFSNRENKESDFTFNSVEKKTLIKMLERLLTYKIGSSFWVWNYEKCESFESESIQHVIEYLTKA